MKYIAVIILLFVVLLGVDFLISALIVKGICWAFGMAFSWKLAIGVWLIISLLQAAFKTNVSVKK